MVLPNLFIPGAAKSATSSLHEYLEQHPQIFMSRVKEPHFFSNNLNFQGDISENLQVYTHLFDDGKDCLYRGESSTGYMVFPLVAERIKKITLDPHLIFILRNPIDRAYSHYWWLRGRGYEPRTFEEAFLADMHETPNPENRIKGIGWYRYYFAFGKYGAYLRTFMEIFGRDRIFIITTEDLKRNLSQTLDTCFGFLGLENLGEIIPIRTNETIVYQQAQLYGYISTVGSQTRIRDILKNSLPVGVYRKLTGLRSTMVRHMGNVMKSSNDYPPLSANERVSIGSFYRDDVNTLREMTGLLFDAWTNDFPL